MLQLFNKFFSLTILAFMLSLGAYCQDGLVVIAHSKGSPGELRKSQLQSILKGERQRWSDGTKVVIALMKTNTAIGSTTSNKVLNMTGDQLNKFWLALVFQGKADAPSFFNSESELEAFVSQTPGAIGIIGQMPVTPAKAIVVDGKKSI